VKNVLTLCALILLAGCDDANNKTIHATPPTTTAKYLYKNTIDLPDGEHLQVSGKLRRYELVTNAKGEFDRYTFELSEDIMTIERKVFAALVKRGYQRKIRQQHDGLFVVNYVRKGFAPVSMTYERIPGTQAFTRLKVIWKNT
jgi:hypothetical protein